jgi:hypothetical protein
LVIHEVSSDGFLPSVFRMPGATFLIVVAPRLAGAGVVRGTLDPVFPPLPDRAPLHLESLADVVSLMPSQLMSTVPVPSTRKTGIVLL